MAFNVAVVAGLASTLTGLLSSGVSIGGIPLTDMAEPEKLTTGGTQMLAVHKLLGGARLVDAMGPDERALDFSGLFRGPSAAESARALDTLRRTGAPVVLSWLSERRTVVIQSFEADWTRGGYRIPYRVSCVVIPQPSAAAKPSLLQQLGADVTSALGIGGIASDAAAALAQVQSALPVAASLTGGSPTFLALSGYVGGASAVASAGAALGNGALSSLATTAAGQGQTLPGIDADSAASGIMEALAAARSAATYGAVGDLVARAASNLSRVTS